MIRKKGQITTIYESYTSHIWKLPQGIRALCTFSRSCNLKNSSCLIEVCHKVVPNSSNQFTISTKCLSERMHIYEPFLLCLEHISSSKIFHNRFVVCVMDIKYTVSIPQWHRSSSTHYTIEHKPGETHCSKVQNYLNKDQ